MKSWPRVIVTVLLSEGQVVKSFGFKDHKYVGDPVNTVRIYNDKHVDELVIIDISASRRGSSPDFKLIKRLASEAFMPVTYVGGVHNFDDASSILRSGIEKVGFESGLWGKDSGFIEEIAKSFGNQALVGVLSYRANKYGHSVLVMNPGLTLDSAVVSLSDKPLGELILYCAPRDGQGIGYDLDTIRTVAKNTNLPVIAIGGSSGIADMRLALESGASGVAAGRQFCMTGKRNAVLLSYISDKDFETLRM